MGGASIACLAFLIIICFVIVLSVKFHQTEGVFVKIL